MDPSVLETSGIVGSKRDRLLAVASPYSGQQARLHEELKAVAYAYDDLAGIDKTDQFVNEGPADRGVACCAGPFLVLPSDGLSLRRAEVVAVQKTARQIKKLIVVDTLGAIQQGVDMDDICVESNEPIGMGCLKLAVDAVA